MRKLLNLFVYTATITVIGFVAIGYWLINEYKKPGPLEQPIVFIISHGENAYSIGERLQHDGVIENADVFKFGLKYLGENAFLKAGEYELEPGMSMQEVIATLQTGRTIEYKITIPECLTSFEIMNMLNDIDILVDELREPPLEGTIFPDTYNYVRGEPRDDIVLRMQKQMNVILEGLWRVHNGSKYFSTPQEALIFASIVEKESGSMEEMRTVSGLFHNRMKKGMRFQSDPTVIYGIVDGKPKTDGMGPLGRRLLKKDLEYDSPYNTYLYADLPPTPICNPGKAAIEAALNPEDHDYIYMVANGEGTHAFAKDLRTHNDNVAKWRRFRANQEAE